MKGKAKNTSFEILRALTFALEGNLDDLSRAVDSTPGIHPETYGAGPELPTTPEGVRTLATAADLNAITDMFADLLREKDANYDHHIQALHKRHADELAALRSQHAREIDGLTSAHVRETISKDKWITLLAIVAMTAILACVIMMIAAIRSPNIELFGRVSLP